MNMIFDYPTRDEIDTLSSIVEKGNYTLHSFESWFLQSATPEYKAVYLQKLLWNSRTKSIVKQFEEKYKIKVNTDSIVYSNSGKSVFEKKIKERNER